MDHGLSLFYGLVVDWNFGFMDFEIANRGTTRKATQNYAENFKKKYFLRIIFPDCRPVFNNQFKYRIKRLSVNKISRVYIIILVS